MNTNKHLNSFANELANKYTVFYNVDRDERIDDIPLAFIAHYLRRDERYMITKKIKVYSVENQQIVFSNVCEKELTEDFLKRFQRMIEANITAYIPEKREHMSTIAIGLIITNHHLHPKVIKEVKRFRKIKFLKYGIHGWVEMYLAVVNPHEKSIMIHSKGRPFVLSIEKMFEEERMSQ